MVIGLRIAVENVKQSIPQAVHKALIYLKKNGGVVSFDELLSEARINVDNVDEFRDALMLNEKVLAVGGNMKYNVYK